MADDRGLLLNWYGPGSISCKLPAEGRSVVLRQETDYPRSGRVRITVEPDLPGRFALRLRIPHWSLATTGTLNGEPIAEIRPGSYLNIDRDWQSGDTIELALDLGLRAWIGEKVFEGRISLYRGPILLAFDRRFNPELEGDDPPALTWSSIPVEVGLEPDPGAAFGVATLLAGGKALRFCDFASAGADGNFYRSWIRAEGVPKPAPFDRKQPDRSIRLGR